MYGKNENDKKDLRLPHRRARLSRLLYCDEELMKVIFLPDLSLSAPKPAQHEGKLIFHGSKQRGKEKIKALLKMRESFFFVFLPAHLSVKIFMTIKEEKREEK